MTSPAERTARMGLAVTIVLAAAKVAVWIATDSLAVLGQALDSAVDVVALALLVVAVRIARKPADESHHYGHSKAENLVAYTQTLIVAALAVAVGVEALQRLVGEPADVESPWYAFTLLAFSAVVDAVRVAAFVRVARQEGSDALRAGALNLSTDMGTALVALASLAAVRFGIERADSVGGLVVAAAVVYAGARLGRRSVDVLMDRAPAARRDEIAAAAAGAAGVTETRRVRVRGEGGRLFADVTVGAGRTTSLERAHEIASNVERAIEDVAPGTDVVVHVEPASETTSLVEQAMAAASTVAGVQEIHNVLVHAFEEAGKRKLHVTLHAKVDPEMSLRSAHDLSDRIEAAVSTALEIEARVDSHIEPLERTAWGQDVTSERGDLVEALRAAARHEPDVLDCHEVVITSADGQLAVVAHVRGRADIPLTRIHEASERIEKAIAAAHPEVGSVVIHFEPAE